MSTSMHWVDSYIGLPYLPHGRDRQGIDCWGLIMLIYREQLGIELDSMAYNMVQARRASIESLNTAFAAETAQRWHKIAIPQLWDVVTFTLHGLVYHAGCALDDRLMVHTENKAGVCVEVHSTRKDLYGYYRYS
jgi:cell wall-associated NlpC family hydrolase